MHRKIAFAACVICAEAASIGPGWVQSGTPPADEQMKLTFWVKLTHTHDLQDMLHRVSDPDSPMYGHYLSKEQLDTLVQPNKENVMIVQKALAGQEIHSENHGALIWAKVPVSLADSLLGGKFVSFCHIPAEDSSNTQPICVLRNPTAKVPAALRKACDVISPLDDGLPPVEPLRNPVAEAAKLAGPAISFVEIPQTRATAGCCFSIGYGAMMVPCCLKTQFVEDVASCATQQEMGGSAGWSEGRCPTSAKEADELISKDTHTLDSESAPTSPSVATAPLVTASKPAGCCFSFGRGAMMKPCCLTTKVVMSSDQCNANQRLGGETHYTDGECPVSADEAASLGGGEEAIGANEMDQMPALPTDHPEAGCCFMFGFGARMIPCCLQAHQVANAAACKVDQRLGGNTAFSLGTCPATAQEAADIVAQQRAKAAPTAAQPAAVQAPALVTQQIPRSQADVGKPPEPQSQVADDKGSSPLKFILMSLSLLICCAAAGGVGIAARRRPEGRSAPFLHAAEGAE